MNSIKDPTLAPSGEAKINWVASYMPLLNAIKADFEKTRPFAGMRIAMSIHLEAKTAYLARVLATGGAEVFATGCNPLSTQDDVAGGKLLATGGAEVFATGCNPLSTQDDVAAALAAQGISVFAHHGATEEEYKKDLISVLSCRPHLLIDDGGDLTALLHGECRALGENLIGGAEETTTGIHRLLAREKAGLLDYPMIDVNDADCKHLFDNRYGTGQSTLDGIMNTTNLIIAGKTLVVAGYGWCGKGLAMRAKGMGAVVVVTEIDPVKAIEAVMDGFTVLPMEEAAKVGDIFVTMTGCCKVIRKEHFALMKDGVLLANSGHFDVEIDKEALEKAAVESFDRKPNIKGYRMKDGRILNLLAEGRLVNLAAGNGHPAEIMDMSFAIQAKSLAYLASQGEKLAPAVYPVPAEIDREVAFLKLKSLGCSIDELSEEQKAYLEKVE